MTTRTMQAEVYRSSPGPHRGRPQLWRIRWRAANGRIVAQGSESYTNRNDALHAISLVSGDVMPVRDLTLESTRV